MVESQPDRTDDELPPPTPWSWLRGFGKCLLVWPLLCLAGIGELYDSFDEIEWDALAAAALIPAALGLVLIGIERFLSRAIGDRVASLGQPVPNMLRDISNVCFTCVVFVVIILVVEGTDGVPPSPQALDVLRMGLGVGVALRAACWLLYGPARHDSLGGQWAPPPLLLRWLGYLTLIPTLLILLVTITNISWGWDRVTHGELAALLLVQLVGQRSAMARRAGTWARTPWEAAIRRYSLYAPWLVAATTIFFGTGAVTLLVLVFDPEFLRDNTIISLVILLPVGLFGVVGTVIFLRPRLPPVVGNLISFWRLHRRSSEIKGWTLIEPSGQAPRVAIRLAGAGASEVWVSNPSTQMLAYLSAQWPS